MSQAYDSEGRIHGFQGNNVDDLMLKIKELQQSMLILPEKKEWVKPVTIEKVIISPMPKEGDILEVNSLKFQVHQDLGGGRYIVKFIESFDPPIP